MSRPSDSDIEQSTLWDIANYLDDIRTLLAYIAKDTWDKNVAEASGRPGIWDYCAKDIRKDYLIVTDVIKRVLGIGVDADKSAECTHEGEVKDGKDN